MSMENEYQIRLCDETHGHTLSIKFVQRIHAALLAKGTNVSLITFLRQQSNELDLKSHKPASKSCLTKEIPLPKSGNVPKSDGGQIYIMFVAVLLSP